MQEMKWPKIGDKFYYFDDSGVIWTGTWDDETRENMRLELGNTYSSYEETEFAVERMKVLAEIRKFSDAPIADGSHKELYCIVFDIEKQEVEISYCGAFFNYYGQPIFYAYNKAKDCIDAIGKERLEKYYFGIR